MIRKYREEDFETLVSISYKAWRKIFEGFRRQLGDELYEILYNNRQQDKRHQLEVSLTEHPERCLICERNGKIAGYVTFGLNRELRVGYILNNAADPDSSEKGVGQEMYAAVFDVMRKEGMVAVTVSTGLDEGHAPARRAYQRAGFRLHTDSVTYAKLL